MAAGSTVIGSRSAPKLCRVSCNRDKLAARTNEVLPRTPLLPIQLACQVVAQQPVQMWATDLPPQLANVGNLAILYILERLSLWSSLLWPHAQLSSFSVLFTFAGGSVLRVRSAQGQKNLQSQSFTIGEIIDIQGNYMILWLIKNKENLNSYNSHISSNVLFCGSFG